MTEQITLYWAPAHAIGNQYEFSHLYPEPLSLYEELVPLKVDVKDNRDDYLRCPAVSSFFRRTFVFRSTTNTNIKVIDGQYVSYEVSSEDDQRRHQTTVELVHKPTLKNHLLANYMHPVIFFTDAPSLNVCITPPYFSQSTHSKFGVIVPGEFNVAKWFRPMNFEFQLWEGVKELQIPANDPIAYFSCQTDAKIVLRKFHLTPRLNKLSSSLIHVSPHRRFAKLKDKYSLFERSKIGGGILREIQDNLVD